MQSIKQILNEEGLAAHKRFGQNFLVNPKIAERIVALADLDLQDKVIEFGVGFGALTRPLAEKVATVIGLEIDDGIIAWHEKYRQLPDNVTIRHADILKADLGELATQTGGPLKIIANLPYSITNPCLFRLVDHRHLLDFAVVMVQKEVGDRLCATKGTKEYGVLSVLLQAAAVVTPLMHLGPAQFHPRPKIDSVVLRIAFAPPPPIMQEIPPPLWPLFRRIVNATFGQRRKTICNSLTAANLPGLGGDKQIINALLDEAGIERRERPERLDPADFVRLTRTLATKTSANS